MKKYIILLFIFLSVPFLAIAQEDDAKKEEDEKEVKDKPERRAFESSYIIDNPTDVVFGKNALEAQMEHRFGLIDFDKPADLAGIYGPGSNIRLGISYAILDRLTLGYGFTKNQRLQDFNLKYAILRQTRSGKVPVNVTYFGNFTYNSSEQKTTQPLINYNQDRFSYFHQIIVSKRFNPKFSMQIAPSLSHYNLVEEGMNNDLFAIAVGGRYKITSNTAILFDYSQPLSNFDEYNPEAGISLGVEFATSSHAFQLFVSNYSGIVSQQNYMWNQNDFFGGDILLGFNITRIYNF